MEDPGKRKVYLTTQSNLRKHPLLRGSNLPSNLLKLNIQNLHYEMTTCRTRITTTSKKTSNTVSKDTSILLRSTMISKCIFNFLKYSLP